MERLDIIFILITSIIGVGIVAHVLSLGRLDALFAVLSLVKDYFFLIGVGTLLIIAGIIAAHGFNKPRLGLFLSRLGLILLILSYFLIVLYGLLPSWAKKEETAITECKQLDVSNVYQAITCLFVGYAPSNIEGATEVTYVNFIIVAIIAPFAFFFTMFRDLMDDMNFPSRSEAKNVIAFVGAYAALRGALASYFVQFFVYGWFGMGVFVFGVFMILMAWSGVGKFFKGFTHEEDVKKLFLVLTGQYRPLTPKEFLEILEKFDPGIVFDKWREIERYVSLHYGDMLASELEKLLLKLEKVRKNKRIEWEKGINDIIKRYGYS